MQKEPAGNDVEIPAQQVDAWKGQILGANHQRHEKVAKYGGHDRDQKEKHHDHAMLRERLVVVVGGKKVALGSEQLKPDQHGKDAAKKKENADRDQVEERDPLVVGGQ